MKLKLKDTIIFYTPPAVEQTFFVMRNRQRNVVNCERASFYQDFLVSWYHKNH